MLKKFLSLVVAAAVLSCIGCDRLDDQRIPPAPVYIAFNTVGEWTIPGVGVGGAMDCSRFIKEERLPAGYHYTAISATGFGGVLLVPSAGREQIEGEEHIYPAGYVPRHRLTL